VAEGVRGDAGEVVELVVAYAKQETLVPLKGVGRFLLFGVVGSSLLSVGLVVLLLALLRALQTQTGTTFAGNLSWVPYVVTAVGAVLVLGFAAWRVARGPARRRAVAR
jgi:hypothetical protein